MSRIQTAFAAGRAAGRPLIVPFVTAGFPHLDSTPDLVEAMVAAGADVVEIGMPFSDPLADGPTIQRASEQALANGVNLRHVLEVVGELRARQVSAEVPLILMGYCNPVFRYGLERFLSDARAAGVDGLIIPDLPPEEAAEYRAGCERTGLAAVFLVAPNAPDDRIRRVDAASTHFSYCVSITGVTGAEADLRRATVDFLRRVRGLAKKPFVVGFGVREAADVELLGGHADGVVIGSALIELMEGDSDPAATVAARVAELRAAAERCAVANAANAANEESAQ